MPARRWDMGHRLATEHACARVRIAVVCVRAHEREEKSCSSERATARTPERRTRHTGTVSSRGTSEIIN